MQNRIHLGILEASLMVPMRHAPDTTGLSRSAIYRAAGAGQITLKKLGRTTLVDLASVRAFLASLPDAKIRSAA
ncbi:MAG: hypothetical protein ACRYHQ_28285 [Janthinobacterium lividum]